MALPKIQDAKLNKKIVLVRVDHNVVKKGIIKDTYRIDASLDTIKFIMDNGGLPILCTHVGRPKDKTTGKITMTDETSVVPIVEYINKTLGCNFATPTIDFSTDNGLSYPDFGKILCKLNHGEIDGIYLPNIRWFKGEQAKGDDRCKFGRYLSSMADIYINDAFGSWQPHASTVEPTRYLPSYAGLLMQKEIEKLSDVLNPHKPLIAVVAGSKFDTKIGPLTAILDIADHLVLGGVLYNAYLCAKYGCTIKGINDEEIATAKIFLNNAEKMSNKIIELPYIVESEFLDKITPDSTRIIDIKNLSSDTHLNYVLDAAPESFDTPEIKKIFSEAQTFFVNAVMGLTPTFYQGTVSLDTLINHNKQANKLFGGGDTLQEFKTLLPDIYKAALGNEKYYFFTGGGTILKAIQENSAFGLGPVEALINSSK